METQEKEYSSGKTYDTLWTEWLPKFLCNHPDWLDRVCKPFIAAKGQDWEEFKEFMLSPDYKCDEVGLLVFARLYHIHIAIIVNDRVWTTHHEHALDQCSVTLGYRGSCEFVLLKPRMDFPPDQEIITPKPVEREKPKVQRKPIDLSASTRAAKNEKRCQHRQQAKTNKLANAVINKYSLRSKKRTTRNSRNLIKKPDQSVATIDTSKGTLWVKMHGVVKPKKKQRSYTCYWCNGKFPLHKTLNKHIVDEHPQQGFHCRYCGENFKTFSGRYKHLMIHIGYKYKCKTCGDVFRYPYERRDHEKKHTKLGLFPCKEDNCNKSFTTTKALDQHRQVHTDEKFTCDACQKEFNTKGYLQQHFRVHDKNFVSRCGRKCKNPTDRQKHQKDCTKCLAKKKRFREVWFHHKLYVTFPFYIFMATLSW